MGAFLHKLRRAGGGHLGIDLGSHSLKVVELAGSTRGIEVKHSAIAGIPAESREVSARADLLRQLLQSQGITTRQAVAAASGQGVAMRRLTLPALPESEIPGAIRWQAGKSFPFPMEDALVSFRVLSRRGRADQEKVEVLAAAATREAVRDRVAVLEEAGVRCLGVVAEAHALEQLWSKAQLSAEDEEAQAVVDLGASKTAIHIFQDNILRFSREISAAADGLTQALTGRYQVGDRQVAVSEAQAEMLKHQYGITAIDEKGTTDAGVALAQLGIRMRPVLEKLETQISRSLDYYRYQLGDRPISRLLLAGGGSQLRGIVDFFSEWFDLEVRRLDPLVSLQAGEGERAVDRLASSLPTMTVATGLALPLSARFNLLPAELRHQRRWQIPARIAYAALGLLFLAPVGQYWWQGEQRLQAVKRAVAAQTSQYERYQSLLEEYQRLQQQNSQLDARLAALPEVEPKLLPVGAALKAISQKIPADVALTEMELQPGHQQGPQRLWLRGLIFGPEGDAFSRLSRFMQGLQKTPVIAEIEVGRVGEEGVPKPASLGFEIVCILQAK